MRKSGWLTRRRKTKSTYDCWRFKEIIQAQPGANNGAPDLDDHDVGVPDGHVEC